MRINRDDRYLREEFPALPKEGYYKMLQRILEASPGVEVMLNTDCRHATGKIPTITASSRGRSMSISTIATGLLLIGFSFLRTNPSPQT